MKCAIYIRVSTDKEEQKSSITNQHLLFEQYVKERNWDIAEIYIDIESGTTSNRENLQHLIHDMPSKKFQVILAKELSRLSRNGALSYTIRDLALEHNIKLITLDGAINMLENSADMFGLYTWLYENEAQKTSERVKVALSTQAKQGNFMGSTPPYGYLVKNKKLLLRPDYTPDIIKKIFNDYLNGNGYDKIARSLTTSNIPTPGTILGKKNASFIWHGSTIRKILENRHYIGDLVQGKETTISVTHKKRQKLDSDSYIIVEKTHEAIISSSIFFTVQTLMQQRKTLSPSPQTRLFSNLLFCKDCRKGMHYRANRKGYTCGTYNKHGVTFCTSHVIKEDLLTKMVLDDINNLLKSIDISYTNKQLNLILEKKKRILKKKITTLKNNCKKVQKENELALKKFMNGSISRSEYNLFINSDSQNITLLEQKLYSDISVLEHLSTQNIHNSLLDIIKKQYLHSLTPSILNAFISRIEIEENNSVSIHYNFLTPSLDVEAR